MTFDPSILYSSNCCKYYDGFFFLLFLKVVATVRVKPDTCWVIITAPITRVVEKTGFEPIRHHQYKSIPIKSCKL